MSSIKARAWRTLMETYRDVVRWLGEEMPARAGVDLLYYDVMLHVSEGEAGRRMTDLADVVVMSKSGLTSLVDRMEAEGLLERRPDPVDRRVTRIVLTAEGETRFTEAAKVHRGMVREVFTSHVGAAEAETIFEVLERVRDRLGEPVEDP